MSDMYYRQVWFSKCSDSTPTITYDNGCCCCCLGVGFQLTPNRKDWTGLRNSAKLCWIFTHGTDQPKQKVGSQTRPAVGTWGRAYCNDINELQEIGGGSLLKSVSNMVRQNCIYLMLIDLWKIFDFHSFFFFSFFLKSESNHNCWFSLLFTKLQLPFEYF